MVEEVALATVSKPHPIQAAIHRRARGWLPPMRTDSRVMAMAAFVYMLRCSDGTYYVGSTRNLEHRVWQHNCTDEGAAYTRKRRPVTLVWSAEFEHVGAAFAFEKQLAGWSRAKKQVLIRGEFDLLPFLARRRT
ncbi:hypothetical protein NLS1_36710 [Nocardioides sp. LS1]|nr:hypothetical protein NLS1_36710 [Nocardioides sp. LS1]